jgi:hypothetical protein
VKMEQTECSETSAYQIQTPENHPKERIQHSEHNEKLDIKNKLKLFTSSCLKYFVNLAVEWITEFSFETERREGRKERRNKKTRNVHRAKHFWRFRVAIATDELSRTSVTVVVTVTVGAFALFR